MAEHFDDVLNQPSSFSDEAIHRLPHVECNPPLDEFPTVSETVKAIELLSSSKASGSDAIPAEIYKAGRLPVAETVISYYVENSRMQHLSIYLKRKGNPHVCDNHRGISLLSIAGTILTRVLLNRLSEHLEQSRLLLDRHCGFRKDGETIDTIFTARQLQEKCQEQNVTLNMTFVDLTKAFHTVSRKGLWKIMATFYCPAKFIAMVRQFHDGVLVRVQNYGEFSDPFPVTNGVKQSFNTVQHDVFCHAYRCFLGW